ncbi:YojF family protein [Alicyclobacillus sp. ALC3]|uniref:YojF family protein n=1 Tax=Alicyclobacillus sp. ALC3 TaxID=2796143 RepID=UPI002377FA9A|nr:YojF family protein [Alicyclobacillus sp. ALC3]WDL98282.1 YojF family protein [Alicyclobacillus sp. ALC3]
MEPIRREAVHEALQGFVNEEVYLHLETTNGAYAALREEAPMAVSAYIRNGLVKFNRGSIEGDGPYRVGLKMDNGWIYAQGLTDWEVDGEGRLLLVGHDPDGRLAVALELSHQPFEM